MASTSKPQPRRASLLTRLETVSETPSSQPASPFPLGPPSPTSSKPAHSKLSKPHSPPRRRRTCASMPPQSKPENPNSGPSAPKSVGTKGHLEADVLGGVVPSISFGASAPSPLDRKRQARPEQRGHRRSWSLGSVVNKDTKDTSRERPKESFCILVNWPRSTSPVSMSETSLTAHASSETSSCSSAKPMPKKRVTLVDEPLVHDLKPQRQWRRASMLEWAVAAAQGTAQNIQWRFRRPTVVYTPDAAEEDEWCAWEEGVPDIDWDEKGRAWDDERDAMDLPASRPVSPTLSVCSLHWRGWNQPEPWFPAVEDCRDELDMLREELDGVWDARSMAPPAWVVRGLPPRKAKASAPSYSGGSAGSSSPLSVMTSNLADSIKSNSTLDCASLDLIPLADTMPKSTISVDRIAPPQPSSPPTSITSSTTLPSLISTLVSHDDLCLLTPVASNEPFTKIAHSTYAADADDALYISCKRAA